MKRESDREEGWGGEMMLSIELVIGKAMLIKSTQIYITQFSGRQTNTEQKDRNSLEDTLTENKNITVL